MLYKEHYIWHNDTRADRPWMLQQGYQIIGTYRTLSAAKGAATRRYRKCPRWPAKHVSEQKRAGQ